MLTQQNAKKLSDLAKEFGVEVSENWFSRVKKGALLCWLYQVLENDFTEVTKGNLVHTAMILDSIMRTKKYDDWVSQDVIPALEEAIKNKKN